MSKRIDILGFMRGKVPQTTEILRQATGVSRPVLANRLASEPQIVRIGQARRTQYAVRIGESVAVYRINALGKAAILGTLYELSVGWFFDSPDDTILRQGEFRDGYYPDLPWFIQDIRPQGFLGRAFARHYGQLMGFDENPERWSSRQVLQSLATYGDDLTGDLIIGPAMLTRFMLQSQQQLKSISESERPAHFAAMAHDILQGDNPGSSAAGEQPKFTAVIQSTHGKIQHVIVKFSPKTDSAEAQRWRDLLRCEHWAACALHESGLGAARTDIIEADGRVFLQSQRYDRMGDYGRCRQISLAAFDDAYFGSRDNWHNAASRLQHMGMLSASDAERLRTIYGFGLAIRNTDMHFGNMSLIDGADAPLSLAPTYDMLPMYFRPGATGELRTHAADSAIILPEYTDAVHAAMPAVQRFTELMQADQAITLEFRDILTRALVSS